MAQAHPGGAPYTKPRLVVDGIQAKNGNAHVRAESPPLGAIVYGGLTALIFGPGGLLLMVTGLVGDWLALGALAVIAVTAWLLCAAAIKRRPERIKAVFDAAWWGLALATLATFNLRFHVWANDPGLLWPDDPHGFHLPPLWLNVPILAFYGTIGLARCLQRRFAVIGKSVSSLL